MNEAVSEMKTKENTTDELQNLAQTLIRSLATVYRGGSRPIELLATAFFAGGHVLLEDIPGVGKTTLARSLARCIDGGFSRIQCTPDLMPSDIIGISIYDESQKEFIFHPGPCFCDILLADELNRTPPRSQSALLEAMNESQVSVDGVAKPLSEVFFCVATQNPQEQVGTYPLPESQCDRFLLSFGLGYPDREAELDLLAHDGAEKDLENITSVVNRDDIRRIRSHVRDIHISPEVRSYLLNIIEETRHCNAIITGASPRASLALQRASQAYAFVNQRDFVIPEDIQALVQPCLSHRVCMRSGQDGDQVLSDIIDRIAVPR